MGITFLNDCNIYKSSQKILLTEWSIEPAISHLIKKTYSCIIIISINETIIFKVAILDKKDLIVFEEYT
jgi:hypothetical protein